MLRSVQTGARVCFRAEADVLRTVIHESLAELFREQRGDGGASTLCSKQVEGACEWVPKKAECATEEEANVAVAGMKVQCLTSEGDVEAAANGAF